MTPCPDAPGPAAASDRIFVTVGAQMPFDRLIAAVDAWAADNPAVDILAQIGEAGTAPRHIRHVRFLTPAGLRRAVDTADLVVAHAGMGTIITCLEMGRPLIVFPRRGDRRETRNDHQLATAARLSSRRGVWVAQDATALASHLDRRRELVAQSEQDPPRTSPGLLAAIREVCDA